MCLNKVWRHTGINSTGKDGEDEDKYRIYSKPIKLPDKEAIRLS